MNFSNFKSAIKGLSHSLSKKSPTILVVLSVSGVIGTTIMAVKATPKALLLIEAEKERLEDDEIEVVLTKTDLIKIAWKCYIPTFIMGATTIACVVGAQAINLRRQAALASLYSIAESTVKEYQSKIVEVVGENKAQQIKDEVSKEVINKNPVVNREIIITGNGDTLCYDANSGRYFKSNIEKIRRVENDLNKRLISEMYLSLNDLYYELDLNPVDLGAMMGWDVDHMVQFSFSSQLTSEGEPCLVLQYEVHPLFI